MTVKKRLYFKENNQSSLINGTWEKGMTKQAVKISLTDRNVIEMLVAVHETLTFCKW